ncbi:response regulator [Inmirania thermothiophila]|uniref:Two-component system response regulator QseB n=1 Tax=Inmirania thermothiophila TaxID=1750597 RepID=A0A3N1Y094_9GAMM|nr:response regulator [Inmirania thermothiophila]ROR32239.1 two-component system response regulator QseB [Inmirania thermothiophila]
MRVLLVEDDHPLGEGVAEGLRLQGYVVDWVTGGREARGMLEAGGYDAVVLDLLLPPPDGWTLLREMRRRGDDTPVLVLTACDAVEARVRGLDEGADDYLVKPFDLDELCARLRAIRRRRAGQVGALLRHGEIAVDTAAHRVWRDGEPVPLTPREFEILVLLLEHRGRVLSRSRLERSLYDDADRIESNAVEVHIHHLRRKLGSGLIRTVRGVGYVIDAPA